MSLTAPTTSVQNLTITYTETVSLHCLAPERHPHKLAPNDTVRACIRGEIRTLTVAHTDQFKIVTTDWQTWWTDRQPGHQWGDHVHSPDLYLVD